MPHHNPCGGLECEGGVWPNPKTVVHRKGWKTADWRGKKSESQRRWLLLLTKQVNMTSYFPTVNIGNYNEKFLLKALLAMFLHKHLLHKKHLSILVCLLFPSIRQIWNTRKSVSCTCSRVKPSHTPRSGISLIPLVLPPKPSGPASPGHKIQGWQSEKAQYPFWNPHFSFLF